MHPMARPLDALEAVVWEQRRHGTRVTLCHVAACSTFDEESRPSVRLERLAGDVSASDDLHVRVDK